MRLRLLNTVLLAEDYERLRDWWTRVVELELLQEWTAKYHYAELGQKGRIVVGIASAAEVGVAVCTPRRSAAVPQLQVDDVRAFLQRIAARGARVTFGPSFDQDGRFWYGGFTDCEDNSVWVVELPQAESDPT